MHPHSLKSSHDDFDDDHTDVGASNNGGCGGVEINNLKFNIKHLI